jgi:hypothetical protein
MKRILALLVLLHSLSDTYADEYVRNLVFPANYVVGDYIEFVQVHPADAGASGYYEISISYIRASVAAAATHIASISHSNPDLWREAGRVNSNGYVAAGNHAFTVDCNTAYGNSRFRVRAVSVQGSQQEPIMVHVKIRSVGINLDWTNLEVTGNDVSVNKFVPMTNDWSLYVGNPFTGNGAALGLKVDEYGSVGIGTTNTHGHKLAVAGSILAEKVKVKQQSAWPDYVFRPGYVLRSLEDLELFLLQHHHLPDVPSEREVKENGVDVGEMNAKLLKTVEEQALYIIELNKKLARLEARMNKIDPN